MKVGVMNQPPERRRGRERRNGVDRRKANPSTYTGIEKRMDYAGRSGRDRRENTDWWSELKIRRVT